MGMAVAFRNNMNLQSAARVRLERSGDVVVETDMTDIGTGSYTIIAQTAAEMMGVPMHKVEVRLGDSSYPVSSGSGGQFGANSSTSGVYAACVKLREAVARRLGHDPEGAVFENSVVRSGDRSTPLADAVRDGDLVAEDTMEWGDLGDTFQQSTFGGHFVEVGVDRFTGVIRVRRMLAVCAAGRILNPKSARSQVIGAMTMGVGGALMEELVVDTRRGFFVNHDLAGYEVPVHADIPHQEVVFLDEADDKVSPMKAKGVGELGLCGVGAAVASAGLAGASCSSGATLPGRRVTCGSARWRRSGPARPRRPRGVSPRSRPAGSAGWSPSDRHPPKCTRSRRSAPRSTFPLHCRPRWWR